MAYFLSLERQKIDYELNTNTEKAFKEFLNAFFKRKVIIQFFS